MRTKKETSTARRVLDTNAKKEMIFIISGNNFDCSDRITKETERAICYHGFGKWLSSEEHGIDCWIPKSIMKREDRELSNEKGEKYIFNCIIIPAWFYNKFLQEKNLVDFN